ncbi:MAG: ATP-binding protein, partial [Anaerolineae bacterium]|nr:ATP-binding protein [Anaerolineae bacterium]
SLLIDPKGDITNLLLTFPDLSPEAFRPWVNPDDARRKGVDLDTFAAQQAELWRKGLAKWGQGPDRIRRLRQSAEFTIYTPGSDAGVPVSILHTLKAPPISWDEHEEDLREKISTTVSALLGLVGIEADPMRSREHILLANIFEHAWRQGEDLDLPSLIRQIQEPPIRQLGVFDVGTFYPPKDRFELAMALNAMIAAPAFREWLEGEPLDIDALLRRPDGQPRVNIFYIAHLSDAERMFFVTLLLEQVLAWMRTQPGTTSLRAILYFDEVMGYFPPVANPPSKGPLLTLMKQARAYGLGVVLVTQNPVDLDYKGLSNAGTWFIGKLQTEQDKDRLLDGIEGALGAGALADRRTLDRLIAGLESRVFLMNNVHSDGPILFRTRWAMSYLRGPLTRRQVRQLMAGRRRTAAHEPSAAQPTTSASVVSVPPVTSTPTSVVEAARPSLPADVPQVFLPVVVSRGQAQQAFRSAVGHDVQVIAQQLVYRPAVLGMGSVSFLDRRSGASTQRDVALLLEPPERPGTARWDQAQLLDLSPEELLSDPEPDAAFDDVPPSANSARKLRSLRKALSDWLYRSQTLDVLVNQTLKLSARPGEDERSFLRRCEDEVRERREAEVKRLRERYERRRERLEEKLRREQRELREDEAEYEARKRETWATIGESILGTVLGRRSTRAISSALRKQRMTSHAREDIEESKEEIASLQRQIEELEQEYQEKVREITDRWAGIARETGTRTLKPRRADVQISLCALAWVPYWRFQFTDRQGLTREWTSPAYHPAGRT